MTTIDFIDISMWQGEIDWPNVPVPAVIKSSESTFTDPRFRRNQAGARAAGRSMGFYHFLDSRRDGAAQAEHFLRTVEPLEEGELLVLDWETDSSGVRPEPEVAQAFVDVVRARGLVDRLRLYGNEWLAAYALQWEIPFWCAWYPSSSAGADAVEGKVRERDAVAWQWSSSEYVDGIAGRVDVNKILDPERWQGEAMATPQEIAAAVWEHVLEKGGTKEPARQWLLFVHDELEDSDKLQARLVAAITAALAGAAVPGEVLELEAVDIEAAVRRAVNAAFDEGLILVRKP